MTPIVIGVEFMSEARESRQPGRLARTVGLDANTAYELRYIIGSKNGNASYQASDT
jgi:hypothetical protein